MGDLKNKVVVITGAANGLGKALATEFYLQGCHLALMDTDAEALERAKKELPLRQAQGDPGRQTITLHTLDVSNEQDVIAARSVIRAEHGRVDVLVNNAGISISRYFEQMDVADYKRLFDVNFWGTVYCCKHFLPDLKAGPDSRLVNIISDFAFMGFPGKTAYGSSKAAVLGFTNALKTELCDTNVKVCYVVPPPMDTGLIRNSLHMDERKREGEMRFMEKNGLPLNSTAKKIVRQIKRGKYRIIIGNMMLGIDLLSRFFPTLLHAAIGRNKKRIDFV